MVCADFVRDVRLGRISFNTREETSMVINSISAAIDFNYSCTIVLLTRNIICIPIPGVHIVYA